MGPRSYERGNSFKFSREVQLATASMGPRSYERGNSDLAMWLSGLYLGRSNREVVISPVFRVQILHGNLPYLFTCQRVRAVPGNS